MKNVAGKGRMTVSKTNNSTKNQGQISIHFIYKIPDHKIDKVGDFV